MRATSITKNTDLNALCSLLKHELNALGFITDCSILNSTSIKIGLPMRSFRVDVKRLGYNGRMSQYVRSQKSYVRTDVPTWDQRVEFNDTVNRVFDRLGLQARIVSGLVTVRDRKQGAWDESQWKEQMAHTYSTNTGYYGAAVNGYGEVIKEVVSEREAREYCDSDRLEREHREAQRPKRLAAARERRAIVKAFRMQRYVTLDGYYESERGKNGKRVTHASFRKLLSEMPSYRARRVKQASIARTVTG